MFDFSSRIRSPITFHLTLRFHARFSLRGKREHPHERVFRQQRCARDFYRIDYPWIGTKRLVPKRCSHFRYLSSSPLSFDPQTELYYSNDLYCDCGNVAGASRSAPVALATPPPTPTLSCPHDRFLPKRGRVFCPSSHAPSTFIVED